MRSHRTALSISAKGKTLMSKSGYNVASTKQTGRRFRCGSRWRSHYREGGKLMRVEIFYPPEGMMCTFEPAFNVPYRLVHTVEPHAVTIQKALDWTWRYANVVCESDPWTRTGLRSAMVGDVFLINDEAHAVMMAGFAQFEFQREGDSLILHGQQTHLPILLQRTLPDAQPQRKKHKDRR
jgi:hypothetical protein